MSTENNTSKSKKNLALVVLVLFLILLPILTVSFSASGLEHFKSIRNDMHLLKDSILIDDFKTVAVQGDTFSRQSIGSHLVLLHIYDCNDKAATKAYFEQLEQVKSKFMHKEDKDKVLYLSMPISECEAPLEEAEGLKNKHHFFSLPYNEAIVKSLRITENNINKVSFLSGVGYLCDIYDISKEEDYKRLVMGMSLIMPKQPRKKYEYKADTDLYKE